MENLPIQKQNNNKNKTILIFIAVTVIILITTVISACVGKYPISVKEVFLIITGSGNIPDITRKVFFILRLPRVLMTMLAGIALGASGCVYQTIFKNPLASPDIIGISGGANLGAAVAIVTATTTGILPIALGSFVGGFAAVICVMLLVRVTNSKKTGTYVLAGIVINAVSRALIMTLKYFADPFNELATMEYWEMGSFGGITLSKLTAILPLFCIGLLGVFFLRRQIGLMALGDNECKALGVRLKHIRTIVLLFTTLLVTSILSITGLIAFIGLIAPHIAKLILKRMDSTTMVLSGLIGAAVVMIADILARSLYSAELPISILTTVIGVPVLVYFMCKRKGSAHE